MSTEIDDFSFLDTNIRGLMTDKQFEMGQRIEATRRHTKYSALRPSELRVLQVLRGRPMSIADVGRRLGVSRQAAHKAVGRLVEFGLVRLERVAGNGRNKRVIMTAAGQRLRRRVAAVLREIEDEIAQSIGRENLETLRDLLSRQWFEEPPA